MTLTFESAYQQFDQNPENLQTLSHYFFQNRDSNLFALMILFEQETHLQPMLTQTMFYYMEQLASASAFTPETFTAENSWVAHEFAVLANRHSFEPNRIDALIQRFFENPLIMQQFAATDEVTGESEVADVIYSMMGVMRNRPESLVNQEILQKMQNETQNYHFMAPLLILLVSNNPDTALDFLPRFIQAYQAHPNYYFLNAIVGQINSQLQKSKLTPEQRAIGEELVNRITSLIEQK